eukprot:11210642-Heterocapsa_arctica.AAC.1
MREAGEDEQSGAQDGGDEEGICTSSSARSRRKLFAQRHQPLQSCAWECPEACARQPGLQRRLRL